MKKYLGIAVINFLSLAAFSNFITEPIKLYLETNSNFSMKATLTEEKIISAEVTKDAITTSCQGFYEIQFLDIPPIRVGVVSIHFEDSCSGLSLAGVFEPNDISKVMSGESIDFSFMFLPNEDMIYGKISLIKA